MGMIRRVIGLGLAGLSAWLFWQGLDAVLMLTARGSPLSDALLSPPTGLWRLTATAILAGGGILVAARLPGGGVLAIAGALLYTALGATLALVGSDSSIWMDEVTFSAIVLILSAAALLIRRS